MQHSSPLNACCLYCTDAIIYASKWPLCCNAQLKGIVFRTALCVRHCGYSLRWVALVFNLHWYLITSYEGTYQCFVCHSSTEGHHELLNCHCGSLITYMCVTHWLLPPAMCSLWKLIPFRIVRLPLWLYHCSFRGRWPVCVLYLQRHLAPLLKGNWWCFV